MLFILHLSDIRVSALNDVTSDRPSTTCVEVSERIEILALLALEQYVRLIYKENSTLGLLNDLSCLGRCLSDVPGAFDVCVS